MIEPILSLALAVQSNKGVYALLLGSGVSRAAGIPTGWEIAEDLIRKLAKLKGQDCAPDPAAWFKTAFGHDPAYSGLLDAIAKAPAERNQLLRSYFEPTPDERERGEKLPTNAHKAVAELVAAGFVRVILTTNFDRLLEQALEASGITPTVISTPDAADGAIPLTHNRCTVIKLHGDYLDTRIKNTATELDQYDRRIDRLLDRVLDEYGLVICGWSAEWDGALRAALERCQSHRFTTYWTVRGEPSETTRRLIEHRRAEKILINDADSFFVELAGKVRSLEDLNAPHPVSAKVAVASLKRYLADDKYLISASDLIGGEIERLYASLISINTLERGTSADGTRITECLRCNEMVSQTAIALMAHGCYWGRREHEEIRLNSLQRIGNRPPGKMVGWELWVNLRFYPALLLLYAGGIASIANRRYDTLATLWKAKVGDSGNGETVFQRLNPDTVLLPEAGRMLPKLGQHWTPFSCWIYEVMRTALHDLLPGETQYQRAFDSYEYLFAVEFFRRKTEGTPHGCYMWRGRNYNAAEVKNELEAAAIEAGDQWEPLKAGLFGGKMSSFLAAKAELDLWMANRWRLPQ